jgi:hypothetical protein
VLYPLNYGGFGIQFLAQHGGGRANKFPLDKSLKRIILGIESPSYEKIR